VEKRRSAMSNVARLARARREARQVVGRVAERGDRGTWCVEAEGERYEARRAVGCLVEPSAADTVLLLVHDEGSHVLCVLDRDGAGAKTLAVDGDLAIEARGGSIALAAHRDLDLVAARRAHFAAGEVDITAPSATVSVGRLSVLGDYLRTEIGKVAAFATTVTTEVDRLVQRVRRSVRTVEESEHVRAGTFDLRAKDMVSVRGHTTLVTAEELVKLDGEQVHLG
jgi:Protein of unknown function (DUF3540)